MIDLPGVDTSDHLGRATAEVGTAEEKKYKEEKSKLIEDHVQDCDNDIIKRVKSSSKYKDMQKDSSIKELLDLLEALATAVMVCSRAAMLWLWR